MICRILALLPRYCQTTSIPTLGRLRQFNPFSEGKVGYDILRVFTHTTKQACKTVREKAVYYLDFDRGDQDNLESKI